jgi:hypothetical protein
MRKPVQLLTATTALLWLGVGSSAAAAEGPWCLYVTMGQGGGVASYCDMPSYEICRAEMRAMGGSYCTQNPYYWWNRPGEPARRSRR